VAIIFFVIVVVIIIIIFLFKTHCISLFQEAFKPSVSRTKQNSSLLDARVCTMVGILLDLKFQTGTRLYFRQAVFRYVLSVCHEYQLS